jgi:hypothetical protein
MASGTEIMRSGAALAFIGGLAWLFAWTDRSGPYTGRFLRGWPAIRDRNARIGLAMFAVGVGVVLIGVGVAVSGG